jgi:hypothetical protein
MSEQQKSQADEMSDQIILDDLRGDAEIARLRLQAAHAEVERLRLTDAERQAVACAAESYADNDDDEDCARVARTLRGLLERTGGRNG